MSGGEKLASETSTSANFADDPGGVEPGASKLAPRKGETILQLPLVDSGGMWYLRTRNTRREVVSRNRRTLHDALDPAHPVLRERTEIKTGNTRMFARQNVYARKVLLARLHEINEPVEQRDKRRERNYEATRNSNYMS